MRLVNDRLPFCRLMIRLGLDLALVMHVYLDTLLRILARWFDLTDPERHFASVVPKKSRECPALLDAILAVAARHFSTLPASRKSQLLIHYGLYVSCDQALDITEETVIYYHNRSITQLRDLASGPDAIMDESLLAAVVALRFFEELDTPFINTPTETGVQGVNVFLRAQAPMALHATGLRAAAFWVGFRQEFNMAFSQQRPIRLPRDLAESYLLWTPAADHIWTNRLIVIGTHVLEYCYRANKPEEGDHSRRYDYDELVHLREEWTSQRPGSFEPVYAEQPRLPLNPRQLQNSEQQQNHPWDAIFPKIWFLDPAHIVAGQTLGLLDILLKAYSPYTPRVGPSRRAEMEAADAQIRRIVLDVCGMGLSNRQSPTAGLTACIAIIICADWFVDAGIGVQKALMEVVIRTTEENNYWPTGESQVRLRRAWGWDE
ncbi:hypothetical protein BJX64DRAFT_247647 [Aspergillus heterothallicus]